MRKVWPRSVVAIALTVSSLGQSAVAQSAPAITLAPATMPRVATIDERFQGYNIEMVEVTGGRFWKPYASEKPDFPSPSQGGSAAPTGMSSSLYEYRKPIDLTNHRLRAMAFALAPAYLRVSGTWANTTYFADADTPPKEPPAGYRAVLTRLQWLGVIAFSHAVDAPIVTSMPIGAGTRDAREVWEPDQSRTWLTFSRANGGPIAAAEYFNEPTLPALGGGPKDYDATAFGRDYRIFSKFMRKEFPETKLLAPGSVGEADAPWAFASGYGNAKVLAADDLAKSTGDADTFSYHFYGALSARCAAAGHQTSADNALSEDWLGRTDKALAFYRQVRDRAMPGKPLWLSETGESACGGNAWAKTYLDSFRYLDQLGRLAQQGVQVVAHNTLAASDYSLLDETTYQPHPNFWAALLWRRLMGTAVLDPGVQNRAGMHVYAHCLRGIPGGVALLVLNTSTTTPAMLRLPVAAQRFTLTAHELAAASVMLNGKPLAIGANDALPRIAGVSTTVGPQSFAAETITFFALPAAKNIACR